MCLFVVWKTGKRYKFSFQFKSNLCFDRFGLGWDCNSIFGLVVILFWLMVLYFVARPI
jgi:hypothetical protein